MDLKVSVIVATYNQSKYIKCCLDSLVNQNLSQKKYEIIIVNDGSTDNTTTILKKYKLQHKDLIKITSFKENKGLPAACNKGLNNSTGEYITRLDSDDVADPDLLLSCSKILDNNPKIAFVHPDYWQVKSHQKQKHIKVDPNNLYTWVAGGTMFRKDDIIELGGYSDQYWEEYDLYLRLLESNKKPFFLPTPLLYHTEHSMSMTAKENKRLEGWKKLVAKWGKDKLKKYGNNAELNSLI
jgi:glycosyltransferase involved in cell wall biosynthesis